MKVYQRDEEEGWYLRNMDTRHVLNDTRYESADAADDASTYLRERPLEVIWWHSSGHQSPYYWVGHEIGWFPKDGI